MNTSNNERHFNPVVATGIFLATLFFLLAISIAVVNLARTSIVHLPVIQEIPPFSLTERSGENFTHADLQGHFTVVDFMFTECPDSCPLMTSKLTELYEAFEAKDGSRTEVQFLSISVDPENDTLEALKRYATAAGADEGGWAFLRGPIEDIRELSEKGFLLAATDFPVGHSTRLILVDPKGQIRKYYDGLSPESVQQLRTDLRGLIRKERRSRN